MTEGRVSVQVRPEWHALSVENVGQSLQAKGDGLSPEEAQSRLERVGLNRLPHQPPPGIHEVLLHQFRSPLIYILGLAALVSLLIGEWTDAGFILAVLVLNAMIGGFQEWRAEKSAVALRRLLKVTALVERGGEVTEISAEQLVPGDLVWLESGQRVPADVRLISSQGLRIDESLLTGESLPVAKEAAAELPAETTLADRRNMAFAGSVVLHGRAKAWVTATGSQTEVGRLALDVMAASESNTPLLLRMEHFTRLIALLVLVFGALIVLVGFGVQDYPLSQIFLFAVALAVSAIPEGLPVAMTVALAVAGTRMARRGVIVRRLAAVEGLGSCTLIASDKTGTLTANELTVREIRLADGPTFEVTGQGFEPEGKILLNGHPASEEDAQLERFLRTAALCNEADLHARDGSWRWRGDPVDVAFLSLALKQGLGRERVLELFPQVNQIPFEPERRFAATFHNRDGGTAVHVKGAPEKVLTMCNLEPGQIDEVSEQAEQMARRGLRVLALAEGFLEQPIVAEQVPAEPAGLSLIGLAGMMDPLRAGAAQAIQTCRRAGVRVCMVTGDHRVTAYAIALELGLVDSEEEVITGLEMLNLDSQQQARLLDRVSVFARVAPDQKLQIVRAAQDAGHFVAVTGDGVNDAPALKAAHIGVAMGRSGTDVAREAAELVISDDNFATIVAGVEEGRVAYDNVRKVISLLVSTGAAEILLMLLAVASGTPLPLMPVQLLWLNLVTNGIQDVALAFEPGEKDVLERPPRPPEERIFNRLMVERTIVPGTIMGLVSFFSFVWMLNSGWAEETARNSLLLLLVLFQNFQVGNCRSETRSVLKLSPLRSPILLSGTLIAFSVHLSAMYFGPTQRILGIHPVPLEQWFTWVPLALTVVAGVELHKLSWQRRHKDRIRNFGALGGGRSR